MQKIADVACREMGGVRAMGNAARRAFSSLTERMLRSPTWRTGLPSRRASVSVAVEMSVVVVFGVSIVEVSQSIRRNVITAVGLGTGPEVTAVNINISDVHVPGDDRGTESTSGRLE